MAAKSATTKRIQKEIASLQKEDLGGIVLEPDEVDIFRWKGWLPGPSGTPYAGGMFEVDIELPKDYPFSPPKIRFLTKVYHCNINSQGLICLDTLKSNWSPALSIYKVMLTLQGLLQDPNPRDPLEGRIADAYLKRRAEHDETAMAWTKKHAMGNISRQKRKQGEEASPSVASTSSSSLAAALRASGATASAEQRHLPPTVAGMLAASAAASSRPSASRGNSTVSDASSTGGASRTRATSISAEAAAALTPIEVPDEDGDSRRGGRGGDDEEDRVERGLEQRDDGADRAGRRQRRRPNAGMERGNTASDAIEID